MNWNMGRPIINIRVACLDDIIALLDLTHQLGYTIDSHTLSGNLRIYLKNDDRGVFVADLEKKVVGYIAFDLARTFHRKGNHMRIVSLVVDQQHRGKGIGKLLLQMVENLAKKQSCWVIEVTSSSQREKEGTHDFYIDQGYLKNGAQAYFRKEFPGDPYEA